jgi:O-antigen ligase
LFAQAHNDPLELTLELGLPAAAAILCALVWLVGLCLRELRARRRGAIFPCIAIAVTLQLGLHSLVDFSMQVPAVMVAYMILLACGLTRADRPLADRGSDERPSAP